MASNVLIASPDSGHVLFHGRDDFLRFEKFQPGHSIPEFLSALNQHGRGRSGVAFGNLIRPNLHFVAARRVKSTRRRRVSRLTTEPVKFDFAKKGAVMDVAAACSPGAARH